MTQQTIHISAIREGSRARNTKKYGNLDGLKDSLSRLGTIHPLVLSANPDNTYDLIAGGRRFRALSEMGVTELHHGSTLRPGKPGFLFENEVPKHTRLEAELDENLYRLDMDWIDSVLLIDDTHQSKKAQDNQWGYRQTAALLGDGYGKTKVNYACIIAKELRKGDKDLLACTSMSEAIAMMVKRQEDKALAVLQQKAAASRPAAFSFLDTINIDLGEKKDFSKGGDETLANGNNQNTATPVVGLVGNTTTPAPTSPQSNASRTVPPAPEAEPAAVIPLSRMYILGDSLRGSAPVMPSLPDACFHHIVTDIPYGIDMDNLVVANKESVAEQHEVEANVDLMPDFLRHSFRLIQDGGFCVFFYDLDHHEKLQQWATSVGFAVQRWPFIATKTSSCSNQTAQYNLTKNYEVAMFCRKPGAVLRHDPKFSLNNTSWKAYDFASERKLYANPFAKPFELWKDIYDMIAFPGQKVYDPFAGEASALRAAANCGLIPFGSEISEIHYNRGVENLKAVYAKIHGNVLFT